MRDTQRNMIKKQRIIVFLILLALVGTILFLKHGGERWFDISLARRQVTYYEIPELSNKINKELSQNIIAHMAKNDEANMIYNSAIKQYNEEYFIDKHYIKNLENIGQFSYNICFSEANTLFAEIRNKQIQVLQDLNSKEKSILEINKMIEDTRQLNKTYSNLIIQVLQYEGENYEDILECITLEE